MNIEYIKTVGENGEKINTGVPLKKDDIYYLSGEENYWLFSSGKNKDLQGHFLKEGIIGIAWDKITVQEIRKFEGSELKEKVRKEYDFLKKGYTESGFNQYIATTVNKLERFVFDIKLGDIIVLKDRGQHTILFGKVISEAEDYKSDKLYIDEKTGYCNKIRKVKWLKKITKEKLGAELKLGLSVRHALSKFSNPKVIDEINRQVFSYFYRGNNLHMVFTIEQTSNINFDVFDEFQNIIKIEKERCLHETNTENIFNIKTNVQSPGPMEYFGNPEIVKYIFGVIVIGGGISIIKFESIKTLLKLKNPSKQIEDGISEGN